MADTQELIKALENVLSLRGMQRRNAASAFVGEYGPQIASLQRRNENLREALVKISSGIKTDLPNRGEYERGWNAARFRMEGIARQALEDTDSDPADAPNGGPHD